MEEMKNLKDLVERYTSAKKYAEQDISGWDPRTANGAIMRKRQAQEELESLGSAYQSLVTNSFVKVFVTGPKVEEALAAFDATASITVDGNAFYEQLAKDVEPSMDKRSRTFSSTQLMLLSQILTKWMLENKVPVIEAPRLDSNELDAPAKSFEDLVARVRNSLENSNKLNLLAIDTERRVLVQSFDKQLANSVIPVVITHLTKEAAEALGQQLFPGQPTVVINTTEKTDPKKLVESIKKKIQAVTKPANDQTSPTT